jgi:hypothetical protein
MPSNWFVAVGWVDHRNVRGSFPACTFFRSGFRLFLELSTIAQTPVQNPDYLVLNPDSLAGSPRIPP